MNTSKQSDPELKSKQEFRNTVQHDSFSESDQQLLRSLYQQRRRYLILIFIFVGLNLYLPRLSRLQTYINVSHKINLAAPPIDSIGSIDKSLHVVESTFKSLVENTFLGFNSAFVPFNSFLEKVNCPEAELSLYASARLQSKILPNPQLERLCGHPLKAAYKEQKEILQQNELDQLGITAEGQVRLRPTDSVFLAGDSLMQGPATFLSSALRDQGLNPIDKSQISTGLAYPEFFDWPAKIIQSIDQKNIKLVVVFLGANDTFDMYKGGQTLKVGSPEWLKLYRSRVERIADYARTSKVPLIWIGMPAMNRSDIQPHVVAMNQIYKSVVESRDGIYLDSAIALGGSHDSYNSSIVKDHKVVKVRADDGVHFTTEGWSIIAESVLSRLKI